MGLQYEVESAGTKEQTHRDGKQYDVQGEWEQFKKSRAVLSTMVA